MNADDFLEEYVWVVYTAGFKEAIIEEKFPALRKAFKGFKVEYVSKMSNLSPVLEVFSNRRKARSVVQGAKMISGDWFVRLKRQNPKTAFGMLEELPYIGPITRNHLARNLGLVDVAKPDRWIMRLTSLSGFSNHKRMINHLSAKYGEKYGVIDLILWRFCAAKFRDRAALADDWRSL
jgi:thermostable 8-oxoguanine DNA glycosylase